MASPRAAQQRASSEPWQILRWRSRQMAHREPLAEGVALTMVRIPAGSFAMGAPETEGGSSDRERPVHRVTLREFLMGQTSITQAQWRAVAMGKPAKSGQVRPTKLDPDPSRFKGDQRPVEQVSWHDAMEFCRRLSQRTARHYTLPSEAQWEYACRAGTTTPFHFGETISAELANYDARKVYGDSEKGEYRQQTTEVASFPANPWGLHDMHGNVWEWCLDHWHDSYAGAPEDGSAWLNEDANKSQDQNWRLLRGGSWSNDPRYCRSAYRNNNHPDNRNHNIGFRVCCLPQD